MPPRKFEILIIRPTTILVQEDKLGNRCDMMCEHLNNGTEYCNLFNKPTPWTGACGHKRCEECMEKTIGMK